MATGDYNINDEHDAFYAPKDTEEKKNKFRDFWETLNPQFKTERLQREALEAERAWNEMMRPQLLRNMGLIEDVDEDGKKVLRHMTEEEKLSGMSDEEKAAYEVDQLAAARAEKAAKGELEIPTYVEDEIKRQKEQQNIALSQRLGARGARLSTPGIAGRTNLAGLSAGVKNAYSYGQENTGLGLLGQTSGYLGNMANRNLNVYGGFANAGVGLLPMADTAIQPYTFAKQLSDERGLMERDRKNALYSGVLRGVGEGVGMYLKGGM